MKKRILSMFLVIGLMMSVSCGLKQSDSGDKSETDKTADGTGKGNVQAGIVGGDDLTDDENTDGGENNGTSDGNGSGEVRISFAAVGDNLIHESVYNTAKTHASALASSGGPEMDYYFEDMYSENLKKIIASSDLAFINQESPIVSEYPASGYPTINTPTEAGDALVNIGFDIVNLANNHMLDMDGLCEGLRSSMNYWKSTGIMTVGAYESREDYNTVRIMQCKGKRIAILSYTYGTNGSLNASSGDLVVPYTNDSDMIAQVSAASKKADAVIVSVHWGTENVFNPTDEQRRIAGLLSKYGADVVIGHHSHTLQPVEWVTNESGEKTLVIYSLGNFISSQVQAKNMVGGLATFELVFSPEGELSVENAKLIPTITHYLSDDSRRDVFNYPVRYDVSVGLLEDYNSDMCDSHGAQHPELNGSFTLDTLKGYVTSTVDSEFLPDFLK